MDALQQLKAEMLRKRKEIQEAGVLQKGNGVGSSYFKRSKLEEVYETRIKEAHAAPYQDQDAKTKEEEKKAEVISPEDTDDFLPDEEVARRLRKRAEPVKLFGETAVETRRRLRDLEMLAPETDQRLENNFQHQLQHADEDYVNELLKQQTKGTDAAATVEAPILTLEDLAKAYAHIMDDADMERKQKTMYRIMKNLMRIWEYELDHRPPSAKLSTEGKHTTATFKQTQDYIKPLLKLLKEKQMEEGLAQMFASMIKQLLLREYIQANDKYLQIAIGNAPWPIGVTNVGIHSRTGTEKISTAHVAHALNDESQRKYLQAWKRLMTFCQVKFPTDPSKSLEFNGIHTEKFGILEHGDASQSQSA